MASLLQVKGWWEPEFLKHVHIQLARVNSSKTCDTNNWWQQQMRIITSPCDVVMEFFQIESPKFWADNYASFRRVKDIVQFWIFLARTMQFWMFLRILPLKMDLIQEFSFYILKLRPVYLSELRDKVACFAIGAKILLRCSRSNCKSG